MLENYEFKNRPSLPERSFQEREKHRQSVQMKMEAAADLEKWLHISMCELVATRKLELPANSRLLSSLMYKRWMLISRCTKWIVGYNSVFLVTTRDWTVFSESRNIDIL